MMMIACKNDLCRSVRTRLGAPSLILEKRSLLLHRKISKKRTFLISYASETPPDKPLDIDLNDVKRIAASDQQQKQTTPVPVAATRLVFSSILFYSCMTLFAIFVGNLGKLEVYQRLLEPVNILDALLWLCPLLFSLFIAIKYNHMFQPLRELKALFQDIFIPQFKSIPIWGFIILAAGAGIGEEALFRGLLQTAMSWNIANNIPTSLYQSMSMSSAGFLADVVSVVLTSLLFGLVHAVSRAYFFYATFAGVIFGVECLVSGLSAAVVTHAVYDAIALACIMVCWGNGMRSSSSSSSSSGEVPEQQQQ